MGNSNIGVTIDNVSVIQTSNSIEEEESAATSFELIGNFPNPFNPITTIRYRIGEPSQVKLRVYNAAGQFVNSLVNGQLGSGEHPGYMGWRKLRWRNRRQRGVFLHDGKQKRFKIKKSLSRQRKWLS